MIITCELCDIKCSSLKRWHTHMVSKGHQSTASSQISLWTLVGIPVVNGQTPPLAGAACVQLAQTADNSVFFIIRSCIKDGVISMKPLETLNRFTKYGFVHNFYINSTWSCGLVNLELSPVSDITEKLIADEFQNLGTLIKPVKQHAIFSELCGFFESTSCTPSTQPQSQEFEVLDIKSTSLSEPDRKDVAAAASAVKNEKPLTTTASAQVIESTKPTVFEAKPSTTGVVVEKAKENLKNEIDNDKIVTLSVTVTETVNKDKKASQPEINEAKKSKKAKKKEKKEESKSSTSTSKLTKSIVSASFENLLSTAGNFDNQLELFVRAVTLIDAEVDQRELIIKTLHKEISSIFSDCQLLEFGSFLTRLGSDKSDIDLTVIGFEDPSSSKSASQSVKVVANKVANILRNSKTGPSRTYKGIQLFCTKGMQIIRFLHMPSGISCDLTFNNFLGVRNSELIAFLSSLDPRVYNLMLIIRQWGKFYELTGCTKLKNYTLTLLVLVFLARKKFLPNIHSLQQNFPTEEIDGWNAGFCVDAETVKKLMETTRTKRQKKYWQKTSVLELTRDFFQMMASEDLKQNVICSLTAEFIPKTVFQSEAALQNGLSEEYNRLKNLPIATGIQKFNLKFLNVQDPINLQSNVGRSVSQNLLDKIILMIEKSAKFITALLERSNEGDVKIIQLFPENDEAALTILNETTKIKKNQDTPGPGNGASVHKNDVILKNEVAGASFEGDGASSTVSKNHRSKQNSPIANPPPTVNPPATVNPPPAANTPTATTSKVARAISKTESGILTDTDENSNEGVQLITEDEDDRGRPRREARYSQKAIRDHDALKPIVTKMQNSTTFKHRKFKTIPAKIMQASHILEFGLSKTFASIFIENDERHGLPLTGGREQTMFDKWCLFVHIFLERVWSFCYCLESEEHGFIDEFTRGPNAKWSQFPVYCSLLTLQGQPFQGAFDKREPLGDHMCCYINPMDAEQQIVSKVMEKKTKGKFSFKCFIILEIIPNLGPNLTIIMTDWDGVWESKDEVNQRMKFIRTGIDRMFPHHQVFLLNQWIHKVNAEINP